MRIKPMLACMTIVCLLTMSATVAADKWLHVHVEEAGGETVNVNIPLSIVESMLPHIAVDELQNGKLQIDAGHDLDGIDLRELAKALRDAPDADFVTVESNDESVRVSKEGDFLVVHANERGERSNERVRVRLPLAVVDALAGEDPNELDLIAALEALGEYEGESLVEVDSSDSSVRVWIDTSETGH